MSIPPFTAWSTGDIITAIKLNQFPTAAVTAFGNIDRSNMGAGGIDASSIIPTTTPAATFGGSRQYAFPNSITVTAGIVTTVGAIQATKLAAVSLPSGADNGDGVFQRTTSTGATVLGGAVGWGSLDYGVTSAGEFTLSKISAGATNLTLGASGTLKTGSSSYGALTATAVGGFMQATGAGSFSTPVGTGGSIYTAGDGGFQHSTSVGCVWVGGSVTSYAFDGGFNNAGKITLLKSGAQLGTFDGTTGAYVPVSDVSLKEKIAPIANAVDSIMALKPSSFTWKKRPFSVMADTATDEEKSDHAVALAAHEAAPQVDDFGFIAQDVQAVFPEAVVVLNGRAVAEEGVEPILGLNYQIIMAHQVAAFQALVAEFQAYVAAHP